jgi:serine/threonine-protein kinase
MIGSIDAPDTIQETLLASPRSKRLSETPALAAEDHSSQFPGAGGSRSALPMPTIVSSPEDALLAEEVHRTRTFSMFSAALTGLGLVSLPFLPAGHEVLRWILWGGAAVCFINSLWNIASFRDTANYTEGRILVMALTAVITTYLAVLFWGVFSAAPAMIPLGMYFFGRSMFVRSAYFILGLCVVLQAGLASLIASGMMVDPGLFPVGDQAPSVVAFTQAVVLSLYGIAFWLARAARGSTLRAIEGLLAARRQASQREAQFEEVRQELDRALVIGGPGRYTDQVLGGYRLGTVLGRGGMGEVYEASHVTTGQMAAVKLLHPNLLDSPDSVRRFLREASAAGAIESRHAVRILGSAGPQDRLPYLVMERLHGQDLGYYLRKKSRLAPRQLVQLIRQVAEVVDAASARGIVHRDLKPQNLLLATDPDTGERLWKVLDFGASKLGHHSGTLTEGRVVGTPGYLSPEQACGEDVDGGADRYGLAAIAYRCVCGRSPFVGKDLPSILYKVVHGMPPQPTTLAAVPPGVDAVLAIGLAKRSPDRFESAAELAGALEAALGGHRDEWLERRAQALLAEYPWGFDPRR